MFACKAPGLSAQRSSILVLSKSTSEVILRVDQLHLSKKEKRVPAVSEL